MKKLFLLFCFITFLVGFTQDNSKWYSTKEEAINYGLEQESSNAILLSVDEYNGETIVFFELNKALGVASITESKKGFSWYRDKAFSGFDGDSPYSTMGFEMETKQGSKISILVGKAFDKSIKQMKILDGGNEKILPITENSRLFYTIHNAPFSSLEVIPIVD
ncbi:hypothetical protein AWH56_018700 [Anaerobacillus isosaccharinicus]|uniref:Uncharacterized protein n=1 Tax=Anaerobacillus isosaccharinicus TaxID=1532552 RepID=A0A1S2M7I4_9BACI|nr:hypothetical protein [Anaerobacillus isosaccharinicus]MBA5587065.1 hypothetical protein [Anaerobacillus isosaccharinicus]QOY34738.1 hypothetical protein AWH56_018700 [Anaerobacillus isosaccharinicus]